jgi:NAD(P)H-dependent flavin oxidoreductase YrpB (nitropropane dioxygenase family)
LRHPAASGSGSGVTRRADPRHHRTVLTTSFTELVGCRVPIQQAPMGLISPPTLGLAVARAGGVGTISVLPDVAPEDLAAQLDEMVAADAGVLAANFLTEDVNPAAVAVGAARVRVADFFWSTPRAELVAVAHDAGALVNWQVGSLAEAVAAAELGADLVTVQGIEAGGHIRGEMPLLPLLAAVVPAVPVPVLAAGGISDARTLAAVLAAGAAGARIGTRFIATRESGAHPEYQNAVVAAGPDTTEITDAFAVCPLCATRPRARVLRSAIAAVNALVGETVGTLRTPSGDTPLPVRAGLPPGRAVQGEVGAMALYAGQGTHLVTSVELVEVVVRELAEGAEALLRAW